MSVAYQDIDPAPHTRESALQENARLRRRCADLERENKELWRVILNGYVQPQKRCLYAGTLRTLYQMREQAGSDTFTVDYYDVAVKTGYFQQEKSEDASTRKEDTARARDKVGNVLRELHKDEFLFKGEVVTKHRDDGTYKVEGVKVTLGGDLVQALHTLGRANDRIPRRDKRGPQKPRATCPHCGSENITYDCHSCGAVNQPGEDLVIVNVPDEPDDPEETGRLILPPGEKPAEEDPSEDISPPLCSL